MSNELVTVKDKLAWAGELAKSGMLPRHMQGNPANLLYACELAESLGLAPIVAITSVHVIEGRPAASAALISALVRKAGHRLRVFGDDAKATAQIWRGDDPDFKFECVWTMERAKLAGLTDKPVWKQYPAAMLQARAITEVARQACQDCLSGVQYTPEELEPAQSAPRVVTLQAERLPAPTQPAPASAPQTVATADGPAPESPATAPAHAPEAAGWRDDADRRWFMAQLGDMNLKYEDVCAWRASYTPPKMRPSEMTPSQRNTLLGFLADMGSKPARELSAWLDARRQVQPEPEPEVPAEDDDLGEGFEAPHAIR